MFTTLVLFSIARASPQSEVDYQSPFQKENSGNNKNPAEMDSLSVTPLVPSDSSRPFNDANAVFGKRSLNLDLWYFKGPLYLLNIEGTFRLDLNSYFQVGAGLSASNGVFFHGSKLWKLSAYSFAKPFWRATLMNTSEPNQTFNSILNYKNLNLGLGCGLKDIKLLYKGIEVNSDVFISTVGYSYLVGVGYSFGF
jgi:hypothetical protein